MSTSTYPAPTSPLYHISISFLKAMNEKDYEAIGSHLDPSFQYRIHPGCVRPENMAKEGVDRGKFLHQGKEWAEKICERLGVSSEPFLPSERARRRRDDENADSSFLASSYSSSSISL